MRAAPQHTQPKRLAAVGIVILIAGCGLLGWSTADASAAQDRSATVCAALLTQLDSSIPASPEDEAGIDSLPVLNTQGIDVAGRLQSADGTLDVPVAAKGADARIAPVLNEGRTGELVAEGRSYQGGLGSIDSMKQGSSLTFTQMDGTVRTYRVADTGTLQGEFNDNFDLLVYYRDTCGAKHWAGCESA